MALADIIKQKFRQAFEHKCFQLMTTAYRTSLLDETIGVNLDENDISAQLHEHIDQNPKRKKWKISTNVESHLPKESVRIKGFSSKFPRVDFRMTAFGFLNEYVYFFEAKNLKQNCSKLKRRYITTGIDNFLSGKYYQGSLIGYLLEGTPNGVIDGINALLTKDNREDEKICAKSNSLFQQYYESTHSNTSVLKHLVFDFTSN